MKTHYNEVKELRLFKNIKEEEFNRLYTSLGMYVKRYKKGSYIALSEEPVRCVSIVLEGVVHMESEDVWGNRTILVFMNPLRAVPRKHRWSTFWQPAMWWH